MPLASISLRIRGIDKVALLTGCKATRVPAFRRRSSRPISARVRSARFTVTRAQPKLNGKVGLIRDRLAGLPLTRVDAALHLCHYISPVCSCRTGHHLPATLLKIMMQRCQCRAIVDVILLCAIWRPSVTRCRPADHTSRTRRSSPAKIKLSIN